MTSTRILAALAALGLAFGCSAPVQAQAAPIKLGVNLERTGIGASFGVHMLVAAQIAVDEINQAGGLNGAPLELVIEDNRSSPEQAVIATRNLADRGVVAMLGPIQSSQARTAFPAANRAELPAVSPGSGAPGLTAKNRPWTFRNAAIDQIIIDDLVAVLRKRHPEARNVVAVIEPKDAYETNLVKSVSPPALQRNGFTFVNQDALIEIPAEVSDFSVFVTRVKALKPDVVLLGIQFQAAQGFLREANRQKLNVPMFGGLGYISEAVAQAAKDIEVYAGQPFDPEGSDPALRGFVKEYQARIQKAAPGQYTTPTYIDAGAYETIQMLAQAIRGAKIDGKTDPKTARSQIRDYFANLKSFQGLGNTLSINAEGDAVKPTLIYRTADGRWNRL